MVLRIWLLKRHPDLQLHVYQGVKNVLQQCYCDKSAVTDELVQAILKPGLEVGAVDVFLDFISYSGGPLAEDLLKAMPSTVPVSVVWGEQVGWKQQDFMLANDFES